MNEKLLQIIRFGVVGVLVVVFNTIVLYLLVERLGIWYLFSSTIAYALSILLNFSLQKFFVFREPSEERIKRQFVLYGVVAFGHLTLNWLLMYVLVERAQVGYAIAQVCIILLLSAINYGINRTLIFQKS